MFTDIIEGLTTGVFGFAAGVVFVEAAFAARRTAHRAATTIAAAPVVARHATKDRVAA